MQIGKFNCIADGSWGSSGKGANSARLVDIFFESSNSSRINISSQNFPNAGHSCIFGDVKFVAKALPSASILRKTSGFTKMKLWLGPNSGFVNAQLDLELAQTEYESDPTTIHVHERAVVVSDRHIEMERPGGKMSTIHIASTMSGSGAAFAEKAMRQPDVNYVDTGDSRFYTVRPMDFIRGVRNELSADNTFFHEVSQGFALSLNHGTHRQTCTFRDCTPQQTYADFGLLPEHVGDVYLNLRTFPIRVGNVKEGNNMLGYSGDWMNDQEETTWAQIGMDAGMPDHEIALLAERERTTVTKRIRRVATTSKSLIVDAAEFCGATALIVNFVQYLDWSSFKAREKSQLSAKVRAYIEMCETITQLPVVMVGTGPEHRDFVWML